MSYCDDILRVIAEHGCKKVAELGVWRGACSREIAKVVDELTLVDPLGVEWNRFLMDFKVGIVNGIEHQSAEIYLCTMGELEKTQEELDVMYDAVIRDISKARFLRMPSVGLSGFQQGANKLVEDGSLDLVCIDTIHLYQYCLAEIKAWLPKLRRGGVMMGDDYVPAHRAVARAVDEVFGAKQRGNTWVEIVK